EITSHEEVQRVIPRLGAYPAPADLFSWKREMKKCATPGPYVRAFVSQFPGFPPEKMAASYMFIAKNWKYQADTNRDWLTPAEDLLKDPLHVSADCKAFALALAACARELHIDSEMVATRGLDGRAGHVQTRIKVSRSGEDVIPLIARMLRTWHAN